MKILQIIVCIFPLALFSQNNYIAHLNKLNEAEYSFFIGDLDKATKLLWEIEREKDTLRYKDYLYLGIVSFLNNDSIKGMKYLKKFVNDYGDPFFYLTNYKQQYNKLNLSNFQNKELMELKRAKANELKNDTALVVIYKSIHDSIEYYLNLDEASGKENSEHTDIKDINLQTGLLNYFKKHGVPKLSDLYVEILFHVSNAKLLKLYKDFFYSQILKGNSFPFAYAILVDCSMIQGTVYGSYFVKPETATEKIKVIENRKKIGMSPYYNGPNILPREFR